MTVRKRLLSHITLMGFVDTIVISTFAVLFCLTINIVANDYAALASENNDIKHSRLKDQNQINDLKLKVDELNKKYETLNTKHEQLNIEHDHVVKDVKDKCVLFDAATYTESKQNKTVQDPIEYKLNVTNNVAKELHNRYGSGVNKIFSAKVKKHGAQILNLDVSAYTASVKECGKKNGRPALGGKVIPGVTCAVSPDLKKRLAHKSIYVSTVGVIRVNDIMADDRVQSIDLAMNTVNAANKFGRQKLKVVVLN